MRKELTALAVAAALAVTTAIPPVRQSSDPAIEPLSDRLIARPLDRPAAPAATASAAVPSRDLPNLDHARVDYWVDVFTTDKRDEFALFLERMETYEPMILDKLTDRGMP